MRISLRVVRTLLFMFAPDENGQHLYHRVLSMACCGFLRVADMKCDVGATHENYPTYGLAPARVGGGGS